MFSMGTTATYPFLCLNRVHKVTKYSYSCMHEVTNNHYEKLKFSDIGKVLEVSESRVCQIHSQAVAKMKKYMSEYLGRA